MEQIIEAKLKENGTTDDEIQNFYTSFKDNLKVYEEIDMETVDVLFGFVDFEKFKEKLNIYKKGIQQEDAAVVANQEDLPMAPISTKSHEDIL